MDHKHLDMPAKAALRDVLGYISFSTGSVDRRIYAAMNLLYDRLPGWESAPESPLAVLADWLRREVEVLARTEAPFKNPALPLSILNVVFGHVLPGYRKFHSNLLFHQNDETLFGPFFLARAMEKVVSLGPDFDNAARITRGTIEKLNDFVGYRPVAVLHNEQRMEPYSHEWVAPVPLYLRGVGVASGRYRILLEQALSVLQTADHALLEEAAFPPDQLDEVALDPRAYDFDHPVHKRTNFYFGEWDPHRIDGRGRYTRFVVRQSLLDPLCARLEASSNQSSSERLAAANVLVATMIMAAGVSGWGPGAHDSSVTLGSLLQRISRLRDRFYERQLANAPGPEGVALREEALALRQPFGGARLDLNRQLSKMRAHQIQHVQLACLFADLGCLQTSIKHSDTVRVASARMLCEIKRELQSVQPLIQERSLDESLATLERIHQRLLDSIECGAQVDPWNILGFGGQFSLFPAVQNSTSDHRIEALLDIVHKIMQAYTNLAAQQAALGPSQAAEQGEKWFRGFATWWDRFAAAEVLGSAAPQGRQALAAVQQIRQALTDWKQSGTKAGDVAFWRPHVEKFTSARAFAVVVETLIERGDFVSSMALLMQWLNVSSEATALAESEPSFFDLVLKWTRQRIATPVESSSGSGNTPAESATVLLRQLLRFFDSLEANAGPYWEVPKFRLGRSPPARPKEKNPPGKVDDDVDFPSSSDPLDDEEQSVFLAAYEGVVYRDSTDDGTEGSLAEEPSNETTLQLEEEATRIRGHLAFQQLVCRWWTLLAEWVRQCTSQSAAPVLVEGALSEHILAWRAMAFSRRQQWNALLESLQGFQFKSTSTNRDTLLEGERRWSVRESLMSRTIQLILELDDAATCLSLIPLETAEQDLPVKPSGALLSSLAKQDLAVARDALQIFVGKLETQRILYLPLQQGGTTEQLLDVQCRLHEIKQLQRALPKAGLLCEALRLFPSIQAMEKNRPPRAGMLSEFDRLFRVGLHGVVEAMADSAESSGIGDEILVEELGQLVEPLMRIWLNHSRQLQLSVVEQFQKDDRFEEIADFIRKFGDELFTNAFCNHAHMLAVLRMGTANYLKHLRESADDFVDGKLGRALDRDLPLPRAAHLLQWILESLVANFTEYRDYDTTTTQSDRGDLLYIFLDLLRHKLLYERGEWNLRPIIWTHEKLVRLGRFSAAESWRKMLAQRTTEAADWHRGRFEEIVKKHGVRLASIADRIGERFIRPLEVDHMLCLAARLAAERDPQKSAVLPQLEEAISEFIDLQSGSGSELPRWLNELEGEVQRCLTEREGHFQRIEPDALVPKVVLPWEELCGEISRWMEG